MGRRREILQQAFVVGIFFCPMLIAGLLIQAFEYDTDEGINLMKTMLVMRGHHLYTEIWNDQPPVFTYLLAGWFKLFGPSVASARCLVLLFSTALIWALFAMLQRLENTLIAALAVLLLVISSWYIRLSFSVMIGLPSMALAMVAMYLVVEWRFRSALFLPLLSGILMGLSLQTKLSSATAIPAIIILFLARTGRDEERVMPLRRQLLGLGAWIIAAAAVASAIVIASHAGAEFLIRPHLAAQSTRTAMTIQPLTLLRRDVPLLILAAVSLGELAMGLVPRGQRLRRLLPVIWFAVAAVSVQKHAPAWYHHVLLLTVPLAWSAAPGARLLIEQTATLARKGASPRWWGIAPGTYNAPAVALAGALAIWLSIRAYTSAMTLHAPAGNKPRIVQLLKRHAHETHWVFSDRPIYPFYADLAVPPELAVISTKRREIGQLTDKHVIQLLRRYRPEQIVAGRVDFGPQVRQFIQQNYARTPGMKPCSHYVEKRATKRQRGRT